MSSLTLSKLYGDAELLYKSDIDTLLTELESKTNGNLDAETLATGWARLGEVTLSLDVTFTLGTTDSAYFKYVDSTDELKIGNTGAGGDTIFKVESAEAARIESTSNNFEVQKDIYFKDTSTSFALHRLIGAYQKPVLVYVDSTTIDLENNTETATQSLIVFPSGPRAVTENTAVTNKFRRLSTAATANGYGASHSGAADSGLRVGLSLTSNTWYFVYAAVVQYGDDANGTNFIMVLDDTNPVWANHATLDSRYGAGKWMYLGAVRRGYQQTATTTLIPFLMERTGWTFFTDRGAAGNYFGVELISNLVTATSDTAYYTMGVSNAGANLPANISAVKLDIQCHDTDSDYDLIFSWWFSGSGLHAYLPHVESDGGDMGFSFIVPVVSGALFVAHRANAESADDGNVQLYVTGFLDHHV